MVVPSRALSAAALATLAAGCDAPHPTLAPVPDPPQALRPADQRGEVPVKARIADYELHATLDADAHEIKGRAIVIWRNRTRRSPSQLPFHLYMNGFRAEDTAWMTTAGGRHRGHTQGKEVAWGYVDVTSMRLLSPGGEPVDLKYAEGKDPSVMRVDLPAPVPPGDTVKIEYTFTTRLPQVFARTGFAKDFHMVGQWFPKLGVLEEEDGWKNHMFTVNDEFYADFGNYQVHLDVPDNMIVGASGIQTGSESAEGRTRLTYSAEMVHDFVWTAYPGYVEHRGEHQGIQIRQLIQPEHAADADAHLAAQTMALDSFQDRYGPYPWSTITIVHPPADARAAGGMEYPTLYTTTKIASLPPLVREYIFDERFSGLFTTVHEFGHQYFQGLFASDEHTRPWLDEGMNTMADLLAYKDGYGEDAWMARVLGHQIPIDDVVRLVAMRGAQLDPIDQPAPFFLAEVGNYSGIVYWKTGAGMLTLRNLVGDAAFRRAMRTYADRWRFRHPTGDDLQDAFVTALGAHVALAGEVATDLQLDVNGFLEQLRQKVSLVDFRIHAVRNRRTLGNAGWHRDDNGELVGGDAPENFDRSVETLDDSQVTGVVVVAREGEFRVPVELMVEFSDGTRTTVAWDGQARRRVLRWPGQRVVMAAVDPSHKLLLELDRLDNVAYAPRHRPDGGLEDVLGGLSEGVAMAVTGVLGP